MDFVGFWPSTSMFSQEDNGLVHFGLLYIEEYGAGASFCKVQVRMV